MRTSDVTGRQIRHTQLYGIRDVYGPCDAQVCVAWAEPVKQQVSETPGMRLALKFLRNGLYQRAAT
jgi:hypothetical protein